MNSEIDKKLRDAIFWADYNNIKIKKGIWFRLDSSYKVTESDIIGALLLSNGLDLSNINFSKPGFLAKAQELLEVDYFWLYRFFMGFDSGYQILIKEKDKEIKDEVSFYGICLAKELFKRKV